MMNFFEFFGQQQQNQKIVRINVFGNKKIPCAWEYRVACTLHQRGYRPLGRSHWMRLRRCKTASQRKHTYTRLCIFFLTLVPQTCTAFIHNFRKR